MCDCCPGCHDANGDWRWRTGDGLSKHDMVIKVLFRQNDVGSGNATAQTVYIYMYLYIYIKIVQNRGYVLSLCIQPSMYHTIL